MRILFIDLGAEWRGGQIQTFHLARELAAGDAIAVAARRGAPLLERLRGADLPATPIRPGGEGHPGVLLDIARAARRHAAELLYAQDARGHGAAFWSRSTRSRALVVHRRVAFPPGRDALSRRKYAAADRFLAISEAVASALRAAGVAPERIAVVPDGLPESAFVSRPPPAAPPFRLAHVGGFDGKKGQDTAVEILARLVALGKDARLALLGDGSARPAIERLAAERGVTDRCEFAGVVADVPERLARSHALLMTSTSEGGSLAVVEAMAAGCPVIAHDVEGAGETVRAAGSGRLVAGLDPDRWAREVAELVELSPELRAGLVATGRAFAATRTIASTARRVRAELAGVLTAARPAREPR